MKQLYAHYIKRLCDIIIAGIALIVLLPILLMVGIFCMINFNGHILFTQKRIGKNEKPFTIYKFITMRHLNNASPLSDSERLTAAGKFLRKYSLDEIPQLFNIMKGDMSWIGPRPLLEKYLPYYREHEKIRHNVKPGITGLAQINGRNSASWDKRLAFDAQYVHTMSLTTDIKIGLQTIKLLLTQRNQVVDPRLLMADLDVERNNDLNKCQLRKPFGSDIQQLLQVKNNKQAALTLVDDNNGYTTDDITNWINFHNSNTSNDIYVIEDISKTIIIGHAGLYNIKNASADFGILIGLPNYWNKGIGSFITKQIIDIGFYKHNLTTINLSVLANHTSAIALYQKIGFVIIKEVPNGAVKNNTPVDLLIMQIQKP